MRIDIFCKVIDNYGDIGVCWRLARDLQKKDADITLWVDDLKSFAKIAPRLNPNLEQQHEQNIRIIHWTENSPIDIPADMVIEAFACDPPTEYIQKMPGNTKLWLNLEYLSAESWTEDFHAQPSPQSNGLTKYFFFPGFSEKTGGLIRENDLFKQQAQWDKALFLQSLNCHADHIQKIIQQDLLLISYFAYPYARIEQLLKQIPNGCPCLFLVPEGVYFAQDLPEHIQVQRFSFLKQDDFDQLLYHCDLNFVRGEDSFIRAIWAAKPFLWQIYMQEEQAHLIKLKAWLDHSQMPEWIKKLFLAWNDDGPMDLFQTLFTVKQQNSDKYLEWQQFCRFYCKKLTKNNTLTQSITDFYEKNTKLG